MRLRRCRRGCAAIEAKAQAAAGLLARDGRRAATDRPLHARDPTRTAATDEGLSPSRHHQTPTSRGSLRGGSGCRRRRAMRDGGFRPTSGSRKEGAPVIRRPACALASKQGSDHGSCPIKPPFPATHGHHHAQDLAAAVHAAVNDDTRRWRTAQTQCRSPAGPTGARAAAAPGVPNHHAEARRRPGHRATPGLLIGGNRRSVRAPRNRARPPRRQTDDRAPAGQQERVPARRLCRPNCHAATGSWLGPKPNKCVAVKSVVDSLPLRE